LFIRSSTIHPVKWTKLRFTHLGLLHQLFSKSLLELRRTERSSINLETKSQSAKSSKNAVFGEVEV
jgi:hypothetical protein